MSYPCISENMYLDLSKDHRIYIGNFDSSIILSDLYIDNITIYHTLFADKVKAHTYHYMYDEQIENKEFLSQFVADKLVFSYTCDADILQYLTSVKEIILNGYHGLEDITLPSNVTTQTITLSDGDYGMDFCAPNIMIQDANQFSGIKFNKTRVNIGTKVRSITVSTYDTDSKMMLDLLNLCKHVGIELCITTKNIWA